MSQNLILLTDSYKCSHWKQYPPKTTRVFSYLESRGGKFPETVFFGLQYLLNTHLNIEIKPWMIEEAEDICNSHFGSNQVNRAGWEHIINKYGGMLPIIIKAVPEGTVVPVSMPLMTVENSDPECYWLTNYVETLLSELWYPITVATLSREIKKVIKDYLQTTGGIEGLDFKLHDFGFRGVSSLESAALGGAAHLINFKGTDTLPALSFINKHYSTLGMKETWGYSIPAAEHSTITSWGRQSEATAYENMLNQYPEGLVAVVSDSYDIYNACRHIWGDHLKDQVMKRNGTLVIRPDSGDPKTVVLQVLNTLRDVFPVENNAKGYKVLPKQVRIIQGDGVNYESIKEILAAMKSDFWSAENIAFGMGGALLQNINRDTQKFAFKCSWVEVDGKGRDVWKDPITDSGKKSKRGRLKLIKKNGKFQSANESEPEQNELATYYSVDDPIQFSCNFQSIRERAKI